MTIKAPFGPAYTQGQSVVPAAGAATITIGKGAKSLCLSNTGTGWCYVRTFQVSKGAVAATTADFPVPPGAQTSISKPEDDDSLSHISAAGTTLHVIPGEGF